MDKNIQKKVPNGGKDESKAKASGLLSSIDGAESRLQTIPIFS